MMKRFVSFLITMKLWLVLVAVTLYSAEQPTSFVNPGSPTPTPTIPTTSRPTSEPFRGDLSIFEGPEREKNLQIDRVMNILGIKSGVSVADIGAGSGWFTVRAAKRVGETGQVFAVDINPASIEHITKRSVDEGFKNIKAVLGTVDDVKLPKSSINAVLILKTYHEFAEPVAIMKTVRNSMKRGGLVGIIDRTGDGADHGLDEATIIKEMALAGFELKERHDFVKPDNMDYFLVFQAK
jgi:SAM-dependent methyltransferase